jgi:DNA polymerase-1
MAKEKILLIDANALVHRAFHALPPLTTKDGELINAVYGFSLILLKAINDINPKYIAIAFDFPKPTFRHKQYKNYKATRQKAPQELVEQFSRIKEVINALSFPIYEQEGFEADDIVGTLSREAEKVGLNSVIVTGDSDEIQLVNKSTTVYTMRRGFTDTIMFNEKMVKDKYDGLTPTQLIDMKTLCGDKSDNIAGVPSVGDKTAHSIVKEFGNIENLLNALDKNSSKLSTLKPRIVNLLKENVELIKQNKKLVTIVTNMPLKIDLEKSDLKNYNKNSAIKVFNKYNFKTLLSKLPESSQKESPKKKEFKVNIINDENELTKVMKKLSLNNYFVFDTETENLDSITGKLVGMSFSINKNEGYYLPLKEKYKESLKIIKPYMENPKLKKIGHNLKYDINILTNYGINVKGVWFDTMIAYYLLHPGDRRFSLDDVSFSELGYQKIHIEELIGKKGKNQKLMSDVPLEQIAEYATEDAVMTYRIFEKLNILIDKEKQDRLFWEIEMPTSEVLAQIERNGVKVDTNFLSKMSKELYKRIKQIEKNICKKANCEINLNSPAQLKELLFEKFKIGEDPEIKKKLKKIKSGGYSTDASTLEKIKKEHTIIPLIIEYRELTKLRNTYLDALPKLINKKTGRIHTSFNQTVTSTGRLSSSDPNLQNIPVRTELGREIRKAFVADKGDLLISADYSQIELRVIAHLSKDKTMIDSFNNNEDIHSRTAAEVNEVLLKDVTYDMRRAAKATNFGIVYGIGAHGLSEQLGWERYQAQEYINKYYEKHPQLINFLNDTIQSTRENGYAETLYGRRRFIPEINSNNFQVRASGERMAINFPAQGTAADIMKKAMINIADEMPSLFPKAKMILQVHDELVFEIPKSYLNKFCNFIKNKMENVFLGLEVPIKVDISYGNNWSQMKEFN